MNKKIKVAQINLCYPHDSTGTIVKDIQDLSFKNKIESFIACREFEEKNNTTYQIGNYFEWSSHAILSRITAKQGFYSYFSTKKFLKKLDIIHPNIIHLHNLHANYINLPLLLTYCANNNIKTVLTLHDTWFFTGKCFHFLDINCDKYIHGCHNCPKKKMDLVNYFKDNSNYVWNKKRELFQNIKDLKVIGCSKWISDRAKESDIFKNKYISYIYNGIDTNIFTIKNSDFRKKHNIENKFVILSFANKWFNEQNKIVTENIIEYSNKNNCIIILVGCSDKQIEQCKSFKNILPFGFIRNREELADIYNSSDVFVNLTLVDTLPTVNMESIACGTPVICYSDCGGGPELIKENMTGYIVRKFDYNNIINSIEKIKHNSINRNYCVEYAKENFDKDINFKKYIDLYMN